MKSTEKRCVDGRHAILRQGSNSRTVSTLVLVSTREVSERIARGAGVQGRRIAETSSWQVDRNLPNNLEKGLRISDCKGSEELGVHLIQIGPFPVLLKLSLQVFSYFFIYCCWKTYARECHHSVSHQKSMCNILCTIVIGRAPQAWDEQDSFPILEKMRNQWRR